MKSKFNLKKIVKDMNDFYQNIVDMRIPKCHYCEPLRVATREGREVIITDSGMVIYTADNECENEYELVATIKEELRQEAEKTMRISLIMAMYSLRMVDRQPT